MKWIKASEDVPHVTRWYVLSNLNQYASMCYCDSGQSIKKHCEVFGLTYDTIYWLDQDTQRTEATDLKSKYRELIKEDELLLCDMDKMNEQLTAAKQRTEKLVKALEKIIAGHETQVLKEKLACSEMAAIAKEALKNNLSYETMRL